MSTTRHPFVDCQGLAGAWSLGTVQAGFDLVGRASMKGGFGDVVIDGNRHLVGYDWEQQEGGNADEWEPMTAAYVCGTPPCSGFSLLNTSAAQAKKRGKEMPATGRGVDSSINDCMKELIKYCGEKITGTDGKPGPQIVSFESVQGAFKQGRALMQFLVNDLRERTGQPYELTHVLMAGAAVGSAQMRHRYYFVAHRIPFGVEMPEERRVATYGDAIGDLVGLKQTWDEQKIRRKPTGHVIEQNMRRDDNRVDGHISVHNGIENDTSRRRIYFEDLWPHWLPGEGLEPPLRRYIEEHGKTPLGAEKWWNWEHNRRNGFSGPCRTKVDKPGYVLTGGCLADALHYSEKRGLTVREGARLMGYPDDWTFNMAKSPMQASLFIGKCCPVQSGRWISEWVKRALDGNPGEQNELISKPGDTPEYLHDSSRVWRQWQIGIGAGA